MRLDIDEQHLYNAFEIIEKDISQITLKEKKMTIVNNFIKSKMSI